MQRIQPPNASWTPGTPIPSPVGEMVSIDAAGLDLVATYKLMAGGILPRPIAFVSTVNADGSCNLAPFSYFNAVSSIPPTIMFAVTYKSNGDKKDTLINIERSGEFVVNTVSEWMAQPMNHCSAEYPYGVSELEKVGLTPIPSDTVAPPRVQESPIHLECKLFQAIPVGLPGPGASTVVIGEIVKFHIHKAAYQDGKVLVEELKPLARLGGLAYGTIGDIFDLPRPKTA
jgi:flavin reductase (DIM6/NTAB) family NADH-FMN oxidoreductase RutF